MPVGEPEQAFVKNPEDRCPVVLLLDTSGSMEGEPIERLNEGIQLFKEEVQKDEVAALRVEAAIVTFGGGVRKIQDFVTIDEFAPPELEAGGKTPMGEAIVTGLDELEDRKQLYKDNGINYFRPWAILMTDGAPTDDVKAATRRVQEGEDQDKHLFFSVGVKGADMETLREVAPDERPPKKLDGLEFEKFFKWVSDSVKSASSGDPGDTKELGDTGGWEQVEV